MTNTVSLRKGWITKTAGLFIVTALAIAYFAFPMLTMAAQDPQKLSVLKAQNVTSKTLSGIFVSTVNSQMPAQPAFTKAPDGTLGTLNLMSPTSPVNIKDVPKGMWIGVSVADSTTNTKYPWLCTVFDTPVVQGTTASIQCTMGQPGNIKMTSQDLISQVQGKVLTLKVQLDDQKNIVVNKADLSDSGWSLSTVSVR